MAKKDKTLKEPRRNLTNDKVKKSKKDQKSSNDSNPKETKEQTSSIIKRPTSGKTPISLLHEHAQKSKWNKVQYDMFKVKTGMIAVAVLPWEDPRTKEVISVKIRHDLGPRETPIEARYIAATVALHRICFNKNLHLVLPREFKELWIKLEDERKIVLKADPYKHDRVYTNDPFRVVLDDRKIRDDREKKREIRVNNQAKQQTTPIVLTSVNSKISKYSKSPRNAEIASEKKHLQQKSIKVKFPQKVWENAPSFSLSVKQRDLIQSTMKSHIKWKLASDETPSVEELLHSLGFRDSHIEEAVRYQDPLSFLLFNVPEDDLPPFFLDTAANDTVVIADKNEILVKKIMEFGVSRSEAIMTLNDNSSDFKDAIISLTRKFAGYVARPEELDPTDSYQMWNEETESLISIYDRGSIKILDKDSIKVKLNDLLYLEVLKSQYYPNDLTGFIVSTIDSKHKLPNYIKLQIITQLAKYTAKNLLGMSYVYSVVEWLQENSEKIIEKPDPLLVVDSKEETYEIGLREQVFKQKKFFRSNPDVKKIEQDFLKRAKSQELSDRIKERSQLPAWNERENILEIINSHRVSLITGETGSGKSTQLVQFILDDLYSKKEFKTQILCTQPRRISAIGLAERVAAERCTKCGEEVGFIIRGSNQSTKNTRIKFLTTGILVKFLQNGEDFLNDTILVLDEVHERSMETDLIIILIKSLLKRFPRFKVVLMSATVDLEVFQKFFDDLATAHIRGRTFPIKDYYLDEILCKTDFQIKINGEMISPRANSKFFQQGNINYDLIASLVTKIHQDLKEDSNDGSILIFLPGVSEIKKCISSINQHFKHASIILPLHSALSPVDQHKVFQRYNGKRKIIVSTNIAETSITIDDCVVTIDTGLVKSVSYSATENTTRLIQQLESQAEAHQRRGRAGRVTNGISYKLFTKETFDSMTKSPIPEIKRINLDSLYLIVKSMGIKDVVAFLNTGLDPPPIASLIKSEEILKCSGLIDEYDDLTELGKFVTLLPTIDPKHGKLLIYSIVFGMVDIGVLIASILSVGSPFIRSQELREDIKKLLLKFNKNEYGDLISTALLVESYFQLECSSSKRKFMNDHHLSHVKLTEIKSAKTQYLSILEDIGFLQLSYKKSDEYLNRNQRNFNLIKSVIAGAFYPQVARVQLPDPKFFNTVSGSVKVDPDSKTTKYWIRNEEYISNLNKSESTEISQGELPATRAFVHPSSIIFDTSSPLDLVPDKSKQNDEVSTERQNRVADLEKLKPDSVEFTPSLKNAKNKALKSAFIAYTSSSLTSKLYLRELTPTSTLSILLFGGPISYDSNVGISRKQSLGIIMDNWLPIRAWSRNAVLIKELRLLLDEVIKEKLENPSYKSPTSSRKGDDVLGLIDKVLHIQAG